MQIAGVVTCTMSRPQPQHAEPQRVKPALHVKSQLAPSQVAVAFAGAVQGVHELPQLAIDVFERHWPEQSWKPLLHATPQLVPSQVAVPSGGAWHTWHVGPQLEVEVVERHCPFQNW
jgi:hypothetical protein